MAFSTLSAVVREIILVPQNAESRTKCLVGSLREVRRLFSSPRIGNIGLDRR